MKIKLILFIIGIVIGTFLVSIFKVTKGPYWMFLTMVGGESEIRMIKSYSVVSNWISSDSMLQISKHLALVTAKDIIMKKGGNLSSKYNSIIAEINSNNSKQSDYYLQIVTTNNNNTLNMTYTAETENGKKVSGDVSMKYMINFADIKKIEIVPDYIVRLRYNKGIRLVHLSNMVGDTYE